MADEGNESGAGIMDLNLYLGLPCSPSSRSVDLGSDLALSSLSLLASFDSEDIRAPAAFSGFMEASDFHTACSTSHASFTETDVIPACVLPPTIESPYEEYTPLFPFYEPYGASSYAQESEAPNASFLPLDNHAIPVVEEAPLERDRESLTSFDEILGYDFIDGNAAQRSDAHSPYSPEYIPASAAMQNDERFGILSSLPLQIGGGFLSPDYGSSSRQGLRRSPEFSVQRVLTTPWLRQRHFRPSAVNENERADFARQSSPSPEQLMLEIMSSGRSLVANGKHKIPADVLAVDSSEKDTVEKDKRSVNFGCNICLYMATEPVVISCGHLFCWPCLYRWLHVHFDHMNCPVCEGVVTEANITPIYGKGSCGADVDEESRVSGLKIPSRPRANRRESWRQLLRPFSQRLGYGILNSWRRLLNQQMRNSSTHGMHEDALMQEMLNGGFSAILGRSMSRRLRREEVVAERSYSMDSESAPRAIDTGYLLHDGTDIWHQLYGARDTYSLAAISADIGRTVGRFSASTSHNGASTSAFEPTPESSISRSNVRFAPAVDQASASSTLGVIYGVTTARNALDEPSGIGPTIPDGRRGRSCASSSSDDGGILHARKRRRLP
ncbi:E3 ubiquitin-protein ligase RMA2 [Apostasia shenzhenica]|uniref:E3 ubiquitin-protein ligase RMA n=1 Tax=Apostasia shenzhenica TaxID=1088818 RepID=A0A2I0AJN5_9ASPA|nr:E3 ubiquitin-protein ligase RMA2 [Apostasia shenzhenica]